MTTPAPRPNRRRRIILVWAWVAVGYLFFGLLVGAAILRRDWSIAALAAFMLLAMILHTVSAIEWHRDVRDFE